MDPSLLDKTEIYCGSKEACWVQVGFQIRGEKKLSCRNVQDCPITVWDRVLENHQLKWGSIATLWRTSGLGSQGDDVTSPCREVGRSGCGNRASFGGTLPIHQDALFIACTPLPPSTSLHFLSSPEVLWDWHLSCPLRVQALSPGLTSLLTKSIH